MTLMETDNTDGGGEDTDTEKGIKQKKRRKLWNSGMDDDLSWFLYPHFLFRIRPYPRLSVVPPLLSFFPISVICS
jgi:hypothetical protein